MDEQEAIRLVTEWILWRDVDYPTDDLAAERFEGGWRVYAPEEVDESDPMAFLEMSVGRAVFLIGDSGRIDQTSSSVPPQEAVEAFLAEEPDADDDEHVAAAAASAALYSAGLEETARRLLDEGEIEDFTIVGPAPDEEEVAEEASRMLDLIVQRLAQLGPPGWKRFGAVLAFTVSAEVTRLRFWTDQPQELIPVPEPINALVRDQRALAARMPAGPWWRLLLSVTDQGRMTADYDYGDEPFPKDYLLAPEHYRNDLATYPRADVPDWLTSYLASPGNAPRPSDPGMVLDTRVNSKALHADPQLISYGKKSIALDQVEWVRYRSVHTTTKAQFGLIKWHDADWYFSVGPYPYDRSTMVDLRLTLHGKQAQTPDAWTFLVNLSQRYLEPRLVTQLAARVRRGETVDVGGLQVSQAGISSRKHTLPWQSISGTRLVNGQVWVYRTGVEKAMFSVPLTNPNALLIPSLFTALNA